MTQIDPEVLVFKEAKELLRCSESTLLDCIHDGSVPAFKLGRGWRFYRADLMAMESVGSEQREDAEVRPICSHW